MTAADLYRAIPPEGVKIGLVLFLAFLLGLEREGHKADVAAHLFGGVRAFPLIGLIGSDGLIATCKDLYREAAPDGANRSARWKRHDDHNHSKQRHCNI